MSRTRFWQPHIDPKRYGRITTVSQYKGAEREMLAYSQRIVQLTKQELERHFRWQLDRLDFIFLDGREPNAVMLRHGNRHAVGICVGLPFTFMKNLERALKSPEFLPEYLTREQRPEWSMRFLGMLIEHAYLHEVTHALRGHLLYEDHQNPKSGIDEQGGALGRYLELDADVHALDMWLAIAEDAEDFPTSDALQLDFYFNKVFTLQLFYQTLDAANLSIRAQSRTRHPAPIHRALLLSMVMRRTIPERHGLSTQVVENAHHQAMWESGVAARLANRVEDRWWGGSTGRRRGMGTYHRMVRHYLERVEPKINAFVASLPEDLV